MDSRFTEKAQEAITRARDAAARLGNNYLGTEHLLLGLLRTRDSVASKALEAQGIMEHGVEKRVQELNNETQNPGTGGPGGFTPRTKRVFEISASEAQRMGAGYVGTEHLLIALLREPDSVAGQILIALGVNLQKTYEDTLSLLGDSPEQKPPPMGIGFPPAPGMTPGLPGGIQQKGAKQRPSKTGTPMLDTFSRDFTQMAEEGRFDPIIGRETEMQRIIQILSRRTKNNPCLVGDPGVGKTAIVEGLSQKIISGDIPETLRNKRIISLDLSSMVAGSKYRGEFEERIKRVLAEVRQAGNIVLFVDEIHTIIGAGAAEGAIDASNILKPPLSRGEIQLIGATTLNEYRKHIEKDAALERRFQPVMVDEPTEEAAVSMIKGLRDKYEAHHNVEITNEAIEAAVKMSTRYINDRFLPDKAIDLIDEAASKERLKSYTAPPEIKEKTDEISRLDREKEEAIKTEEFEKAGDMKRMQEKLREELEELRKNWAAKNNETIRVVGEDEVADIVSGWTGVPVRRLVQEEGERLTQMEEHIHKRIVGQNEAVSAVSKAIRRGRVGLKNPRRPTGSFLFLGPTGVGKTELSKALAEILFGNEDAIIRVDMSEYMEKHSVSKIIGSPPGYVGYDEGGQLSEKVRRKPYSVILFDEIEKAHPDVFNILLQILDDGQVTDSHGRKVNFKNTVIIMTSNAGARNITENKRMGFANTTDPGDVYEKMKKEVMDEVKRIFRPEFINRIDEIIVFSQFVKEEILAIARLQLNETIARVETQMGISLTATDALIAYMAEIGHDPLYGARPLRRAVQTRIEDPLSDYILQGRFKRGDAVVMDYTPENGIRFN
ncbi:MAG: ATP-dependent Clp protease ATP-binding subunit [Defluviitaleaceae bacterium]|nr:ATP-dependent Clp protease ATP-binding subunit [Defluviitaleaceae bacterium]MCL2835395.1 ATP-dependent Clp protease ATP-binding subunit [Defluviitaleaceae bacterium]